MGKVIRESVEFITLILKWWWCVCVHQGRYMEVTESHKLRVLTFVTCTCSKCGRERYDCDVGDYIKKMIEKERVEKTKGT